MLSLLTVGIILSGLAILLVAGNRPKSGLDKIPNAHFSTPFSRAWLLVVRWRERENRTRLAVHHKHGPLVRIGPREVSVDCVDDGVRQIYGSKFEKDEWYRRAFFDNNDVPFMVLMLENEQHRERKKLLSHVYSKSFVLSSPGLDVGMTKKLDILRENMSSWTNDAPVDVLQQTRACMMDISTSWLYGPASSTNFLRDSASLEDFSKTFYNSGAGFFWYSEFDWYMQQLKKIGIDITPEQAKTYRQNLRKWSTKQTAKALDNHQNKASPTANVYDHLQHNLELVSPDLSPEEADRLIAAELYDHIVASFDGGGIALTYAVWELSKHPERQAALRSELATLKEPSDKSLSHRIEELPVLDATLTETLRVHPPGPGPWPRVVPETGCRIAGYEIPPGTIVSSTAWTLHRNSALFPEPDVWRPERWLEADDATKMEMRKWWWAFGSGARMCIGVHYSIYVFKAIIAAIYADFETQLAEECDMDQVDAPLAGPKAEKVLVQFRRAT